MFQSEDIRASEKSIPADDIMSSQSLASKRRAGRVATRGLRTKCARGTETGKQKTHTNKRKKGHHKDNTFLLLKNASRSLWRYC